MKYNVQKYKANKIDDYSMTGWIVFFLCLDIMLLGIAIFLHIRGIYSFNKLWGIFPLILGVPGMLITGFNLVYLGLSAVGGITLAFSNIPDKSIAILVSFLLIGFLGMIAYFIHRKK